MSNEKNTTPNFEKQFEGLDEKVIGSMLVLARIEEHVVNGEEEFFKHVKESFTHDELAYLAAVHIGEKLKSLLLRSPDATNLVVLLRQADALAKRMNEEDKKSQN